IPPRPPISTLFPYTTLFRSHLKFPYLGLLSLQKFFITGLRLRELIFSFDERRLNLLNYFFSLCAITFGIDFRLPLGFELRHQLRSEEHTSELQSLTNLVCRL